MVYYICKTRDVPASVKRLAREHNKLGKRVWVSRGDELTYKVFVLGEDTFEIHEYNTRTKLWNSKKYKCRRISFDTIEIFDDSDYPALKTLKAKRWELLLRYEDGWDDYCYGIAGSSKQVEGFFVIIDKYHNRFYDPDRFNIDLGRIGNQFTVSLYVRRTVYYANVTLNGIREFGDFEFVGNYIRRALVGLFETVKSIETETTMVLREMEINFETMSYTITFQEHNSEEETKYTFKIVENKAWS